MLDPAETSPETMNKLKIELILGTDEDLFTDSATPLKARKKGFPVMPPTRKTLGMFSQPRPSAREMRRPCNGPSIDEWEAVLVGKRLVKEDAEQL